MGSRITQLVGDSRRPGSVRVEIDGERFGAVGEECVAAEHLMVGQVVDGELRRRLATAADVESAYRTVLRALEQRAYARSDLARRLVRRGHPRSAVETALERAQARGLLNDEGFAQHYVQTRAARGRGPARLVRDLLALGVERATIDRAVAAEWPEGTDPSGMPFTLAARRAAQLGDLPRPVKRRRVLAYLARRGFAGREITEMVGRVVK